MNRKKPRLPAQGYWLHRNSETDADKQAVKEAESGRWPNEALLKARLLDDGGYYNQALQVLAANRFLHSRMFRTGWNTVTGSAGFMMHWVENPKPLLPISRPWPWVKTEGNIMAHVLRCRWDIFMKVRGIKKLH